jgi:HEAT repeat protein
MTVGALPFPIGALGLSRSEFRRALPVAVSYAALLASIYVLKPARNTLFLDVVGVAALPWVLLAVAVLGAGLAGLLARLAGSVSLVALLPRLFFGGAALIVLFRWLLIEATPSSAFAFYLFVNLFGQITSAFVWLWATSSFDPREARRVFGFIAGAGIFGAFAGGAATGLLAAPLGTLGLLWLGAGLSALAAISVMRARPSEVRTSSVQAPPLAAPWGSPLVRWLSLGACIGAATSALVDLQFNARVDAAFESSDEKTAFFGAFFAALNLGAFAFQLLVSPRLLRRFGIGTSVLLLPSALTVASLLFLWKPAMTAGALLKTADVGLRHSLGRSVTEVLFGPLPPAVRLRARVLLDATFDNLGTGLGAGLGLLVSSWFANNERALGAATFATALLSMWASLRLRPAYVEALRKGLLRREIQPEELHPAALDSSHRELLLRSLSSENLRRVAYALHLLKGNSHPGLVEAVVPLLSHPESLIRSKAVGLLAEHDQDSVVEASATLLRDVDPTVRSQVMTVLANREGDRVAVLATYLASPDPVHWEAALASVADGPAQSDVALLDEGELQRLGAAGARVKTRLIQAVGSCLERFGAPDHVDWLVSQLGDPRVRAAALQALERAGALALPALERALAGEVPALTRGAARVLSRGDDIASLRVLATAVRRTPPARRGPLLTAFAQRRRRDPHPVPWFAFGELVDSEASWMVELARVERAVVGAGASIDLLRRALTEKQVEGRLRLLRSLALGRVSLDVARAEVAVTSTNPSIRARGLELLDEALTPELRERLLHLFDPSSLGGRSPGSSKEFPSPWLWLSEQPDLWLEKCAQFAFLAGYGNGAPAPPRWQANGSIANVPRVLSLVEKVLLLQNVDVFAEATSEQLSLVAAIAEESQHAAGSFLYREGESADAMFVMVRGRVKLHRGSTEVSILGVDEALGTWALLEDEPRLTSATLLEESVVLRIGRDAFLDVLADHVDLTRAILARVARRLRAVLGQTGSA